MEGPADHTELMAQVLELGDCSTSQQLHTALDAVSRRLGFDAFLYCGRFKLDGQHPLERVETSYPLAWRRHYEASDSVRDDPTVEHALRSLRPLVWSNRMFVTERQRDLQRVSRSHALLAGVSFPVHGKEGEVAVLNLAMSRSGSAARRHVQRTLAVGALMASMSHDAMRAIVRNSHGTERPKLTKREAEVLQWIARGKSTWEISRLIVISEHGVVHHVRNLLRKFDATSRHQAVARAIACGLL